MQLETLTIWLSFFTVVALAVAGVVYVVTKRKRLNLLPPGPPAIFKWYYKEKNLSDVFQILTTKYGDIFGLYFGKKYVVVLNDYLVLKEVSLDKHLNPKLNNHVEKQLVQKFHSVFQDEVSNFLVEIEKVKNQPIEIAHIYINNVSRLISDLIHSQKLEERNVKRVRIKDVVESLLEHVHPPDVHVAFTEPEQKANWDADKLHVVIAEVIKTVRKESTNGYPSTGISSGSLCPEDSTEEKELIEKIYFLLQTASSTILAILEWTLFVLAQNPEAQQRCQGEITKILHRSEFPDWSNHHRLPFTMAVLLEVQRLYCIYPLTLTREISEEIKIDGYTIPNGTLVVSNLWRLHHHNAYWLEDNEFLPERFLTSDKRGISKPEFFVPLSYVNSGETWVDMIAFAFITSILQRFTISNSVRGAPEPKLQNNSHIRRAESLNLIFTPTV